MDCHIHSKQLVMFGKTCLISPSLFNLFFDEVMEHALGLQVVVAVLVSGQKLCDIEYAGDLMCLFASGEHAQRALGRLGRVVAPFKMCFTPPESNVL